jgi:hypothetical protein
MSIKHRFKSGGGRVYRGIKPNACHKRSANNVDICAAFDMLLLIKNNQSFPLNYNTTSNIKSERSD